MPIRNSEFAYKQDHPFEKRCAEVRKRAGVLPSLPALYCQGTRGTAALYERPLTRNVRIAHSCTAGCSHP